MTAKRFTVMREVYQIYKDLTLYEVSDGTHTFLIYENAQELTDLLNKLADENEVLKEQLSSLNINVEKNCITCKYCETYDEGEGYGFVSLCDKDCMNTDGYFDWEYHRFKKYTECPLWECDKDKAEWWNE